MKAREAIKQADALRPNCIDTEVKANILRELENEYAELMGVELPENLWPEDQSLLMPVPHDNSYVHGAGEPPQLRRAALRDHA